jgi:transmembrane sensor
MDSEKIFHTDEEMNRILDYVSGMQVASHITKDGAWENLHAAIRHEQQQQESRQMVSITAKPRMIFRYAAAAIIIGILCTVYFTHFFTTKEYSTGRGKQLSFYLPDGSLVKLNSESTLSYNAYRWYQDRKVFLTGEAYFMVEKGKPFSVCCENCTVKVLGTTFNVCSRNKQYKVECVTGKVKVSSKITEKIITPGEALFCCCNSDSITVYPFDVKNGGSWTRGEFYFNHNKLDDVFKELERQYDISITCSNAANRIYSGYFNTSSTLGNAMDMICQPMGLTYKIVDNRTVIVE